MKTINYFPVSTNNFNAIKSLDIRMKYGWAGYGIYFALLQKIASEEVRAFALNEIPALAYELHCEVSELTAIIQNYFIIDDTIFFSPEMNEWLIYYDLKYARQSEGGKTTANQLTPEERKLKAKRAINIRWNQNKPVTIESDIKPIIQSEEKNESTSNSDIKPIIQSEEKNESTSNSDIKPIIQSEEKNESTSNSDIKPIIQSEEKNESTSNSDKIQRIATDDKLYF